MAVRLVVEDGPFAGVSRSDVLRRARAMLGALRMERAELSLLLTSDARIQELNRLYRYKDQPTDVLAFAQREGELAERAGRILGDVVVSIPTAKRQGEARGSDLMSELTMLLAHGLLHLLGWDHDTAAKDRRMRRETARLCLAANAPADVGAGGPPAVSRATKKGARRDNGHSVSRRAFRSGR